MLTAEISVLDCCLSWLVAFLAQLNPLEAPVMDTLVAGHIRKVWASSESKCRMRDVHITMDTMTLHYRILIKLWQTISLLAFLFLHTCQCVALVEPVAGSRLHTYFYWCCTVCVLSFGCAYLLGLG